MPQGYRIDQDLGRVYEQPPVSADDLTRIRGIETREAVALNRLGIYFFAQIANWRFREISVAAKELGISAASIVSERWAEQAENLCRPAEPVSNHALPASFIRTVSLLVCALFLGCLVVYWIGLRQDQPLPGVLSADITSLRVPTESRLLSIHVTPGDEVFSNEKLLTIEKTEHLAIIENQRRRVELLRQQLQQSEAQASLDLEWRTRELDEELAEVRIRANLIQEVKRQDAEPLRAASLLPSSSIRTANSLFQPVSQSRTTLQQATSGPEKLNSILFFSGSSDATTVGSSSEVLQVPEYRLRPRAISSTDGGTRASFINVESRTVEARLRQLEDLRERLPEQVRRAAGVESLRLQHDEESRKLADMDALSREVAVLSPAYGTIGQIRYREGDTMSSGEIMLKILHSDRRYIQVYVPTRQIADVHPGSIAEVTFPGDQKYLGSVTNVPLLVDSQSTDGDVLASVRVEPIDKLWPSLPVGSHVDVRIKN